jgi:hypothetical protein
MAKTRGTGLLMAWIDIDPAHEDAFNRWYDEEQIARMLALPGFLSAARYVALRGGPKYLAMYELEDHRALRGAAFLDAVGYPHPGVSGGIVGRNYLLNGYRQIFPARTNPIDCTVGPAPFLQMGRIDIAAAIEEEFNDWYNTVYIPGYLSVPGCLRARRYRVVEGHPKYLTVYEFENAAVPDTPEWARARAGNPWNARMRPQVRLDEGSPAVFRRITPT